MESLTEMIKRHSAETDALPQNPPLDFMLDHARRQAMELVAKAMVFEAKLLRPVPMVLYCPVCQCQHIDKPAPNPCDTGPCQYAKDVGMLEYRCADETGCREELVRWKNPPHRSHQCQACDHIWRPADIPTVGVARISTRGKADNAMYSGQISPKPSIDEAIGGLDRGLSDLKVLALHADEIDEADIQTIKHHAEDCVGLGNRVLEILRAAS